MKLSKEQAEKLRQGFANLRTKEDFVLLLNQAKTMLYGDKAQWISTQQVNYYVIEKGRKKAYKTFFVTKKNGSRRTIHAPKAGLKMIQECLACILTCVYQPSQVVTGFVPGKSVVDNAKLHLGKRYVYNIDLKDFFPSIEQARVWKTLQLKPFNLNLAATKPHKVIAWAELKKLAGVEGKLPLYRRGNGPLFCKLPLEDRELVVYIDKDCDTSKEVYFCLQSRTVVGKTGQRMEVFGLLVNELPQPNRTGIANIIAGLCCTAMEVERMSATGEWETVVKNVLPQGAPTSPIITNIVCQKLDFLLGAVAKRFGLTYSRYADDITFSSMHNVYQPQSDFINELHRVLATQNFTIKESKTRLQKDGYRKEVTGLLVNDKVNVQQRYIKQLRSWLYYWETYGYDKASSIFKESYRQSKSAAAKKVPAMEDVISGKLQYLKMVRGAEDTLYLKLRLRFDTLTTTSEMKIGREEYLNKVINLLLDKGVDDAMDIYKPQSE